MTEPKYRCSDCKLRHKGDQQRRKKLEEAMACDYMAKSNRHQYLPDHCNKGNPAIKYNKCIGNYYFGQWTTLINYYPKWEQGILPYDGGYFDQPLKFVEAMELVHNLISENTASKESKNNQLKGLNNGKRPSKR
jgi:hypothetical protein